MAWWWHAWHYMHSGQGKTHTHQQNTVVRTMGCFHGRKGVENPQFLN
jgi:hypothetical protein